ncbi:carbohydrate ABC transporter membrane protein 2, CUT1 family [Ignavigranum ruoffiae]|uniref:Carbohydrate ABC transporter membrane protein 2, CUT1 family n=1 Tax=Ignavigranum ruoffiae TaxID=89093 RepID=A0A1H9GM30_9LACT|nr:carbohydrate ABC transporter permease [Ignavigranum ruoffiae]SEQ51063.1 carbohydrate ABC transporter membrane protein 2, CUT1 family [Ignavigranum ruoffiae]
MRRNQLFLPIKILNYFMLLLLFLSMILPMINILSIAFSSNKASMLPGISLWPKDFSFEGFRYIWQKENLWRPLLNSIFVSTIGSGLQTLFSAIAAFILLKKDLPFRTLILSFIMVTMMIPGELTLVSIYTLNKNLGFINTYRGLIINGLVSGFSILLLKNYFQSIPESVFEAAKIDRASELKIFRKICLPMSKPGIATVSFIAFISKWNSLMIPVTIITDQKKYTLPLILKSLVFNSSSVSGTDFVSPNAIMAAIVISTIPLILAYLVAQRYLITGMTLGSVKG